MDPSIGFPLLLRTIFYLFYSFSRVVSEQYWSLFGGGLLNGLAQGTLWVRRKQPFDQEELGEVQLLRRALNEVTRAAFRNLGKPLLFQLLKNS